MENNNVEYDKDYNNFFNMIKFWIVQTNKNIENNGGRVSLSEIKETEESIKKATKLYKNPIFAKEYLFYNDFIIRISFTKVIIEKGKLYCVETKS